MNGKQQYFTRRRLEKLKEELADLKTRKRIEVGERLKRAKELGDLSENSEYFEAREEQARVETSIAKLEDMIKNAQIIEKTGSTTTISVGSTIQVEKDGQIRKFTIVGSNEANPSEGLISNESPLGSSFLNKASGEKVLVTTPSGKSEYTILSIE